MRQLFNYFLLGLLIFFVYCNQSDHNEQTFINSKKDKALERVSDSIRIWLSSFKNDPELSKSLIEDLVKYFKENESTDHGTFPSRDGDIELFYGVMELLRKKAENDTYALRLLIMLSCTIKRSPEFTEYLMKLTPNLAIKNTTGFVLVYKQLDKTERDIVIKNLEYLKGPYEYRLFQTKLNEIKDNSLRKTAIELKQRFEKELMK